MAVKLEKSHLLQRFVDLPMLFTLLGVEYECQWLHNGSIRPKVAAASSVFIEVTIPAGKYMLFNKRILKMDLAEGYYRLYASGSYTAGTVTETLPIVKMRTDTAVQAQSTFQLLDTASTTASRDDAFLEIPLFGVAGQGPINTQGDIDSDSEVRVVAPGKVLVEFANADPDNAAYWRGLFKWYEVSEGMIPVSEVV